MSLFVLRMSSCFSVASPCMAMFVWRSMTLGRTPSSQLSSTPSICAVPFSAPVAAATANDAVMTNTRTPKRDIACVKELRRPKPSVAKGRTLSQTGYGEQYEHMYVYEQSRHQAMWFDLLFSYAHIAKIRLQTTTHSVSLNTFYGITYNVPGGGPPLDLPGVFKVGGGGCIQHHCLLMDIHIDSFTNHYTLVFHQTHSMESLINQH